MNRAEEKAEEYCKSTLVGSFYVKKMAYLEGYHQAEKDLELSWEDIDWIVGEAVCRVSEDSEAEQICKEVLKRFKDLKNGTTK